ncbi:MAG: response regulator [Magnetococcales bacterium]|nr:response regulator [Magnetococcales bacterium]
MSPSDQHIAIVDDDPWIRDLLSSVLKESGYRVSACQSAKQFWDLFDRHPPDLVVLDLNLPDEDGLTICRSLRSKSSLPILILTSRSDEVERVIGLEMGADDYLVKPVFPRELQARVKGLLRRSQDPQGGSETPQKGVLYQFAGWRLRNDDRFLISPSGEETELTQGTFRLLRVFLDHPGQVLSRERLLELTQGRPSHPFDRSIDNMVSRLRRRLSKESDGTALIRTVRGEGYRLTAEVVRERSDEQEAIHSKDRPPVQKGSSVLVVDDDEIARFSLQSLLESLGCQVWTADRGREAISRYRDGGIDLVLMDCHMPEMDGYETCRRIRQLEQEQALEVAIPIIAVSFINPSERQQDWAAAGMNDFLEKPVSRGQLQGLLLRWRPEYASAIGPDGEPSLDLHLFESLHKDLGTGFPPFLRLFLDTLPKRLAQLSLAMEQGAYSALISEAERLLGGARSIGALRLAACCQELIDTVQADQRQQDKQILIRLGDESMIVEHALQRHLAILAPESDTT